jgi:hypothetical protein
MAPASSASMAELSQRRVHREGGSDQGGQRQHARAEHEDVEVELFGRRARDHHRRSVDAEQQGRAESGEPQS